ncbi:hypothetical protein GLOTRDRAFT_129296 [Gloeophyllum trabeum ATCC 11539]|uniref:Uncharacterized protein n=1 Tax=Gloeophyllum trabeum (strain ATCC 11539 / FP-39264 / Madison 617) TaxID=670483 RepID=S7RKX1_GLOTA|nr:uncharacterized protein GLOTRDRAFT_129296 [Gloeophyllum trabeum ATCC 11539]EPQ54990.1 hypothetical protein GLOTRDRAFT_129296 [Gloeophyllum trabeum ATCC 11539]
MHPSKVWEHFYRGIRKYTEALPLSAEAAQSGVDDQISVGVDDASCSFAAVASELLEQLAADEATTLSESRVPNSASPAAPVDHSGKRPYRLLEAKVVARVRV